MGDEINISVSGRARVQQVIGKVESGSVTFDNGMEQLLEAMRAKVEEAAADGRLRADSATVARQQLAEAGQALERSGSNERKEGVLRALRGLADTVRLLPDLFKSAHEVIDLVQRLQ